MKNIFIAIIVIVMLPLLFASITESGDNGNQELKGFSDRDIQFIESIGFVDNLDGSWTITVNNNLPTSIGIYWFDYQPISIQGKVLAIAVRVDSNNQLQVITTGKVPIVVGPSTFTIWGGEIS